MKRPTVLSIRALIVLALLLAAFDVRIPSTSTARRRLHLIDRSSSVTVPGGLVPREADEIRAADLPAPGDNHDWASFGRNVSFASATVDPGATDLAGALEAVLARSPTEIVLYTDGRADPGRALFLCRERGVPVNVFPLGPPAPRDVRLVRIEAPPRLAAGERGRVELTVESSFPTAARVRLNAESKDVALSPGIPLTVPFPVGGPGPFQVRVEAADDFDRNNAVAGRIEERTDERKALVLSDGSFPPIPGFKIATAFEPLEAYDVVVLAGLRLRPPEQQALARYARDFGGGALLLGGPASHELGGWKGTPIEEISPLRASPDQRVAVVFGIDSSGSMREVWDQVCDAVLDAREAFGEGDTLIAMTFADRTAFPSWQDLRRAWTGGATRIAGGIADAREKLVPIDAGRKHVVLLTDGHAAKEETPEQQRQAAEQLRDIGLTVVTTDRKIDAPRAKQIPIKDWKALHEELGRVVRGLRENAKENPGALELQDHPVSRGVGRVELPWMNLVSAKPGSQVLGTVGRAPAVYPAVALRAGTGGTVGALAFPYEPRLHRLFTQAVEFLAGEAAEGVELSVVPPLVRVRSPRKPPPVSTSAGPIPLEQVRSDVWEGALPPLPAGTVTLRCGRARAAATIPASPEDAVVGVDRKMLERIAAETGGRLLRAPSDLAALPRPARPEPRSGRPMFLVAALALVFLELALSTFWKER